MLRLTWILVATLALVVAPRIGLAAEAATGGESELKPGTTLDSKTAPLAKDLLPPEILKHYEKDEYVNEIVAWPMDKYNWPTDFKAASDANEGKYEIAAEGHIIDKATGQQPPYILGFPFPTIDPKDPKAGNKALWNFFYRTWYFGSLKAESQLNMTNPDGLARRLDVIVSFMYFDGVPEGERPKENKGNFISKFLTLVDKPADVNGTAALTWRYRDPGKRDSSWTYVPALRRVRQVSPANRSDGFLGSDMSQDDGPFFDGKVEDFTWKLTGEKKQLRFVDPINLEGKSTNHWQPEGGWDAEWPDVPIIGYTDPNWKGLAWAPIAPALAERDFWIVEGVPKDRYYLYGNIELYIDKVAFQGAWNRKTDWKGTNIHILQVLAYEPHKVARPDGQVDFVQGSNMAYQSGENLKMNRATVAGIKSAPKSRFHGRAPMNESIFDLDALARKGK
jgi:hypothetical protein